MKPILDTVFCVWKAVVFYMNAVVVLNQIWLLLIESEAPA